MPGFITHNMFGTEEYKKMGDCSIKTRIRKHRNVYNLGLQGPDLFFYYPFAKLISKRNLGSMMHSSNVGKLFDGILKYIEQLQEGEEKDIAVAYLSGFLGHYMLDSHCHPYIYFKTNYENKTKSYHARHVELETDLDYLFCKDYFKMNVNKFPFKELVSLSNKQRDVLAKMLSKVCSETYGDIRFDKKSAKVVLYNFEHVIEQIKDKAGRKESIVKKIENKVAKRDYFSTLFIGDKYKVKNVDPMNLKKDKWHNPWNREVQQNESLMELIEKASKKYQEIMKTLEEWLIYGKDKYNDLIELIGNNSFTSGLKLED